MNSPSEYDKRWWITVAVMLVAIVEVLDMTIVNVALPNMMGALGANADQITWVLTSYIVSSAICMPLTGFLVNRVGRKRLLLIDIVGFLLSSMLCGLTNDLTTMVIFRTLQGAFGATLVPLSQYILRDTFSHDEQGKAMAIWGIGIMAAPVLGPTLGGYITENLDWRWIFYINVPVCIIAFFMTIKFIKETVRIKQSIDWVGLFWMALGIGTLQVFLDQGNEYNWLSSDYIITLIAISGFSLALFAYRGARYSHNIINLHLFKDRNLSLACIILTLYCLNMFGLMAIQPMMLENLMNYPTETTGIVMAPRGFASAVGMAIVVPLMKRIDHRWFIGIGALLSAYGSYLMAEVSLSTGPYFIALSGAVQGLGMGILFVPISAIALSTLSPKDTAEGSGLFSFGRSLGSSIGISILGTLVSELTQINWNRLGGHINPSNPALMQWLAAQNLTLSNPLTPQLLGQELSRQASMVAFVDCYWFTAIGFLVIIPLTFFFSKTDFSKPVSMGH